MDIIVNNQQQTVNENTSLASLVDSVLGEKQKGVAVAVNDTVVAKTQWPSTLLQQNDNILIIKATQGG